MEDKISIKGARVHNLKNIDLEIPKNKLVVFTGVSGSGKSSLAFDTIFAEGQRRYIESLSPYARQFLGQMERADVDEIVGLSPAIAIDQRALSHNPRSTVGTLTEIYDYLRILFARLGDVHCPHDDTKIEKLSVDEMIDIIVGRAKKAKQSVVTVMSPVVRGRKGEYYQQLYDYLGLGYAQVRVDGVMHSLHDKIELSRYKEHSIDLVIDKILITDISRLHEAVEGALDQSKGLVTVLMGEQSDTPDEFMLSSKWTCPVDNFVFPDIEPRLFSFNSPHGMCETCSGLGKTDLFLKTVCPDCKGKRLRPEALSIRINGKNIYEVASMTNADSHAFFAEYEKKMTEREITIAANVVKEVKDRLQFLLEVGLDYLTMTREAETLSGGEAQRIRLSSQIGSQLSNTLYVLDEPTIGLHERDTDRLVGILKKLKAQNNTVIIVEHDELTILESDYLVDFGPFAGKHGGEIVAQGETATLLKNPGDMNSMTVQYLREERKIAVPQRRDKTTEKLSIIGATAHNLKNVNVDIPLRKFVCVTGVSGSGKSTLIQDALYENLNLLKARMDEPLTGVADITGSDYIDRVVAVDQAPIGRTPRSNPATYTGILTPIREFYAQLPEARERAYTASRFSFNVAGGRCESCQGAGHNLIEMHFLPPVLVECEVCHGKRYNRETLQVKHNKKNISDVLAMTIDEGVEFFDGIWQITDKLKILQSVGLGYLQLGQSATTLSGGEAQRIKLARELTHPLGKRVLYLLDEPTVGLHYYDVELLLTVLNKLVDKGHSVVVIEHNMHLIKSADYVIDLGPEGGARGGAIVAKGTPEEVADNTHSITGSYLKHFLK
ncbi:MAG: Excinuclease ABC, subunit A [Candidatus Wolfebacteria bacterium GW2011_GWE1_48_7]|uniref:UvrABC system protein A n=2 Tax=Candidatus Wolfeibacteriota TaxID=1752735 RepID=A0A0G1WGF1_9BACT|nr:MAG: excinuclease ABC subunit A, excinuclease ABC subunit A [Candidatus Wolfebacteria bacterium GW2011_GWB1_47_1]KKU42428.1 MAG: Excinuclease ABC, subunit A [Candidatus Wolfebacteria bacterium GW2011_GWB2_46_69]KKU54212.1 MAG: Excinuclease ABC, subunit A [Candidatus Wolfebacteria bacterium GW2011_GWC1_47_103]KKU66225.1 MAG: Excinuclease ABC, subunit A [Candidatus Wolfebacteria bacterium GW2011_GWD2_47_17]KKU89408.1 MAG: Excinuclease ABC, subunit A [Candidatus Wolfebacteria bacterium GW2011_G